MALSIHKTGEITCWTGKDLKSRSIDSFDVFPFRLNPQGSWLPVNSFEALCVHSSTCLIDFHKSGTSKKYCKIFKRLNILTASGTAAEYWLGLSLFPGATLFLEDRLMCTWMVFFDFINAILKSMIYIQTIIGPWWEFGIIEWSYSPTIINWWMKLNG